MQTGGEFELRGRVKANAKGEYAFASYKPKFYSIPIDGRVGDLIRATTYNHVRRRTCTRFVSAPGQPVADHATSRCAIRTSTATCGMGSARRQVQEGERRGRGEEARHAEPVPQAGLGLRLSPDKGVKARKIAASDALA